MNFVKQNVKIGIIRFDEFHFNIIYIWNAKQKKSKT